MKQKGVQFSDIIQIYSKRERNESETERVRLIETERGNKRETDKEKNEETKQF